jgi:transglutaminase-like putative cysteine protease
VFLAAVIGYLTPVYEPKWPDPVPFLENTVKDMLREKSANLHKVGYGEDDSRLGGSFVQDYTTVFRTQAQKDHYWRIETKDEYTGKGWKSSVDSSYTMADDGTITLETFSGAVETEQLEATLDFQGNTEIEKLVYPYGAASVDTEENVQLLTDDHDGEIRTQINSRDVSLNHYTIHYQYPSFSINAMREAGDEDPGEIAETYTQLPPSLPSRVDELAEEITADETNRYDKARAVEKYFGRSGFVYQLSNVPVPEADQDYVDQFLFDTKKGYCDNYSTSMIVLLRTLDIPARWAKGFTSGERIDELNDGSNLYEITSANAHSWVEVYFPEIGWVPFEPTQGFSNLADFHLEEEAQEGQEAEEEAAEEKEKEQETEEQQHKPEQDEVSGDEKEAEKQFRWKYASIVFAGLILFAAVLYLTRWHWLTAYYRRKWENHPDAETFASLYQFTLKMLRRKKLPKMPDETLREYAARVDRELGTDEMGRLTAVYERLLYHHDKTVGETAEITKLWKDLITHLKG